MPKINKKMRLKIVELGGSFLVLFIIVMIVILYFAFVILPKSHPKSFSKSKEENGRLIGGFESINNVAKNEVDNSWKSENYPGKTTFMLRKNNIEETNKLISNMKLSDKIKIKRHILSLTEINVYDSNNRLLGSIPKEISSDIAKKMDWGIKYDAKIIGAFGKNGLEILIWQTNEQKGNQNELKKEGNVEKTSVAKTKVTPNLDISKPFITRIAGVTFEGRQSIIAGMSPQDRIYLKRDYNNTYDPYAIGVHLVEGRQIGWIPAELAKSLAPLMDSGTKYTVRIKQKLGGNGYSYGVGIEVSKKEKSDAIQSSRTILINEKKVPESGRLVRSSISIGENTVLTTFNSNLLNIPYQIKMDSNRRKNEYFGNYWDYTLVEINTGFGKTISQKEIINAMAQYGNDYMKMGISLFDKKDFYSKDINNFLEFTTANVDYFVNLMFENNILNPKYDQMIQVASVEIMTLMAEAISLFIEENLKQSYIKKNEQTGFKKEENKQMHLVIENQYLTYNFVLKEVEYQIHYSSYVETVLVLKKFGNSLFVEQTGEPTILAEAMGTPGDPFRYTIPIDDIEKVIVLGPVTAT
ncbi:HIRAN domain-containing protein [Ectobacillus sp. sgz5001026]|uniref:HIRAN domain-containing protein n=1 Tax=Ectobacillus sp. sgz5001026 TaxID=3242473 RepID=UPI0036D28061